MTRVPRLPTALNGIIERRGDVDAYRVAVKRGDRLRIRVFAATLGSPIDPKIRIRSLDASNKAGAVVVETDDTPLPDRDIFGTSFASQGGLKDILDPSVVWEPTADGDYLLELEDTSGSGGPTAVYRIEVEPAEDAVHTLLTSTAFDWMECVRTSGLAVPQGNRWTVNLSLPEGQGNSYRGALDLVAQGLPAGVHLVAARVQAGQRLWPVQFVADDSSTPGTAVITLEAKPADSSSSTHFRSRSQQNIPFINHPGGDAWRHGPTRPLCAGRHRSLAVFDRDQTTARRARAGRRTRDSRENHAGARDSRKLLSSSATGYRRESPCSRRPRSRRAHPTRSCESPPKPTRRWAPRRWSSPPVRRGTTSTPISALAACAFRRKS